jgi:hypothetical protein
MIHLRVLNERKVRIVSPVLNESNVCIDCPDPVNIAKSRGVDRTQGCTESTARIDGTGSNLVVPTKVTLVPTIHFKVLKDLVI